MTLSVALSPVLAIRIKPGSRPGSSLPAYAQLAAGEVKSVSSNTVPNVAPPNPFQGTDIGSIGGANYWCQGQALLNPYYGSWGAMVAYGLTGHAANYAGTEAYIAAFGQTGVSWVRMTDPCPFGGDRNFSTVPQTYYDDTYGEWKFPGAGGPDWFGHPWVGDHTRGHQVAVSGGTGNQGRLFFPKSGTCGGIATYRNWAHIFDCGVETGTPSYDRSKPWSIRATTVGPAAGGFGGGCWFEPDSNIVRFLSLDTTFVQSTLYSYDVSGSAPVLLANRSFSPGTFGQADGAVEYIASRKLAMSWYRVGGTRMYDMTVTSGTIPMTVMSQWAVPPFPNTTDWVGVAGSNRMVYCPLDGNFYVLDINRVYNPTGAPRLLRYTPPMDLRSSISNSAAMATAGGGEASRWVDLTSSLTGTTIAPAASNGTPGQWNIYNGLCWHEKFSCFAVCTGTSNPIQLIKPPAPAPTPG